MSVMYSWAMFRRSYFFLAWFVCSCYCLLLFHWFITIISGGDIPDGKNRHLLTLKHPHVTWLKFIKTKITNMELLVFWTSNMLPHWLFLTVSFGTTCILWWEHFLTAIHTCHAIFTCTSSILVEIAFIIHKWY